MSHGRLLATRWDPVGSKRASSAHLRPPGLDEASRFRWATSLQWLDLFPINLNPCLQWAMDMQHHMGPALAQWRESARQDDCARTVQGPRVLDGGSPATRVEGLPTRVRQEHSSIVRDGPPSSAFRISGTPIPGSRPVLRFPPTRPFAARSLLANTTGFQVLLTPHHRQSSSSAVSTWNMSAKPCATPDHQIMRRHCVPRLRAKPRRTGSWALLALPGCLRTRAPWVFEPPGPSQSNSKARFAEVTTGFAQVRALRPPSPNCDTQQRMASLNCSQSTTRERAEAVRNPSECCTVVPPIRELG